jgi:hypothetical protein
MDESRVPLLADVRTGPGRRLPQWGRRAGLVLLLAVVVLGAAGFLGVRSRTAKAQGGGYTLTVTYPHTARAGLDVPWQARVHRAGGVDSDVTLAITSSYFHMFETQGFYPDADTATNDGRFVYMTFTKPPAGQDFVLDYDAYIQPSSQVGKSAVIKLIVHGTEVAHTSIHTWLVP